MIDRLNDWKMIVEKISRGSNLVTESVGVGLKSGLGKMGMGRIQPAAQFHMAEVSAISDHQCESK